MVIRTSDISEDTGTTEVILPHAVAATGAAMLPSVGLCLNASKAESALDRRGGLMGKPRVPPATLLEEHRKYFRVPVGGGLVGNSINPEFPLV